MDNLRCNRCFVQERGREAFDKEFLLWLKEIFTTQGEKYAYKLRGSFNVLHHWSRSEYCSDGYRYKIEEIVRAPMTVKGFNGDLSESDLILFQERHERWLALKQTLSIEDQSFRPGDNRIFSPGRYYSPLPAWDELYDEFEAIYQWLKAVEVEVEERVDEVIGWALEESG